MKKRRIKLLKPSNYEIDMVNGPLFFKIIKFSLPLMLSGVLQLLYNAADIVVVGRYVGSTALAAVGSTASITNLIISLFIGLSVGTSVLVAQYQGAGEPGNVSSVVHTSIAASVICGIIIGTVGIIATKNILIAMGSPADVIDQSVLYLRIIFTGMPVLMLYNFGSAILRAVGDTRRPLFYLTVSGLVNVTLNFIFVAFFHMGVAGVAVATVISQVISAVLVLICLMQYNGACRLILKDVKIHKDKLIKILKIGVPAGLQGTIFSLSNVLIQSSVNSFGSAVMAGNSASSNIEGFTFITMNSFHHAALAFTGQNVGAGKYKRVKRIFLICSLLVCSVGIGVGTIARLFGKQLLGIYAPGNAEVIGYGMIRLAVISSAHFTAGLMDVLVGMLRGMGTSLTPMIVSLAGVCGIRIAWIYTVFSRNRDLKTLYLSYPVSWSITALIHLIFFFIFFSKLKNKEKVKTPTG
ncbi:MAG: MATE family efflux transporter [Clostridiaceae bacterium]|jgi:putative MATE family efflux protein|nr:MATE family efflux transporter [Clostridiaceae bacterium]